MGQLHLSDRTSAAPKTHATQSSLFSSLNRMKSMPYTHSQEHPEQPPISSSTPATNLHSVFNLSVFNELEQPNDDSSPGTFNGYLPLCYTPLTHHSPYWTPVDKFQQSG
ncbi:hypothetical protein PM082_014097 [Marasmius tenuissimus]|nr:hypothetical protein PM082_014097 [Marasmius tenuissimus]